MCYMCIYMRMFMFAFALRACCVKKGNMLAAGWMARHAGSAKMII